MQVFADALDAAEYAGRDLRPIYAARDAVRELIEAASDALCEIRDRSDGKKRLREALAACQPPNQPARVK
jgi:hypothetical protein